MTVIDDQVLCCAVVSRWVVEEVSRLLGEEGACETTRTA
jgi:hypothetical protein